MFTNVGREIAGSERYLTKIIYLLVVPQAYTGHNMDVPFRFNANAQINIVQNIHVVIIYPNIKMPFSQCGRAIPFPGVNIILPPVSGKEEGRNKTVFVSKI